MNHCHNPDPMEPGPRSTETGSEAFVDAQSTRSAPAELPGSSVLDAFDSFERQLRQLESSYADQTSSAVLPIASGAAGQASATSRPAAELAGSHPQRSQLNHEEGPAMNAQTHFDQEPAAPASPASQEPAEPQSAARLPVEETDGVLLDVQSTLDSLAGMAHGLSQQRQEMLKAQEALEERRAIAQDRERLLSEREERLLLQEQRLHDEKHNIERSAEQNAAVLAERGAALQALAETVEGRDRATTRRAELLDQEQQHVARQMAELRARAKELDEREALLQRQGADLAARLKQLLDAKERFGVIVKGFNETVRFNTVLSAISKSAGAAQER